MIESKFQIFLENIFTFEEFESLAVDLISKQMQDDCIFRIYLKSKLSSREINAFGCYCNFDTNITLNHMGFVGSIDLYQNSKCVGGCMLYFDNGILSFLEAYFWEENFFFINLKS